MTEPKTIEVPIAGMDCMECTTHVRRAIAQLPGVHAVDVLLAAEKAIIQLDPERVDLQAIRDAVSAAGYAIPATPHATTSEKPEAAFDRPVLALLGGVFGAVLLLIVMGEGLGLLETLTTRVPWQLGLAIVALVGYPAFLEVVRAASRGQIVAHTLMTVGVIAALVVGEWATAAVLAFFMRVGNFVERFTSQRARRSLRALTGMAPMTARVAREGVEYTLPVEQVLPGDTVIVRPGEQIPVDGEVVAGHANVDQASITGESLPVDVGPGAQVFAATFAALGSLRIRAHRIGQDTTFGRVIRLVQEAEAHRADVQRAADRFSTYYLPIVAAVAAITFLVRRDPLVSAAVLVVACSCAFALATPIAMLASIGAAARRGLLIKGGKHLETLARADVLLIDKTGTLTLGQPRITDIRPLDGLSDDELLLLAASAERYSEHPLAEAVRQAARGRELPLRDPFEFAALPGLGVRARVEGQWLEVGSHRLSPGSVPPAVAAEFEGQGKTVLYVKRDGQLVGVLAAADSLRAEVPHALEAVRALGVTEIELLTGDHHRAAAAIANELDVRFRAGLLPEDKIAIVKGYQRQGRIVVMVGDGVNDAPALAQADVGIAMGAAGSGVAIEAAHIALLRDDWSLVPESLRIARRTMRVIHGNIAFTAIYNLAGLTLAALGFLPPILAAAAQSLPDLGVLANSSRLLKQR